ncbi:cytochrome-c oxidase, cbb3-type subunit III [Amantichitinum ursilacus]|uniref:Cbb3-type cytochrome c oxidase subunit n=1 Tax=Amantichitinum ursilacus TaxID=857265 RepID=A0A0N0GQV7_9NEIS|nr:cytochrome-c oxidase, cbb3-type subunit III [Amantichitinum ursilacus]KPC55088.1 Cbb3-type cytochrome c oxidase subunit CcoP [Amantichitinum ursilacus]
MSDFYSSFWGVYITVIVVVSLVALAFLVKSQAVVKVPKGEKVKTLDHVWDGDLQEYNNPLPSWWIGLFVMTIVFAVAYLALYPGLVLTGNMKHWSARSQLGEEVAKADAKYSPLYDKYLKMPVEAVAQDKDARDMGKRLFLTYCLQCHGADARGAKGFPNLVHHDWMYGGTPDRIVQTISGGRHGQMPAFGAAFGEEKVRDVANYVLKISGNKYDADRAGRGESTFKQVCAACHGPEGHGNTDIGSPNLTHPSGVWLYGKNEATIIETVTNGRSNVMPAWKDFLGDAKVHVLAGYVYSLSHNAEQNAQ